MSKLTMPFRILILLLLAAAAGCTAALPERVDQLFPSIAQPAQPTRTPFQPVQPTPTATLAPTSTPEPLRELAVWLEPSLPKDLRKGIRLPEHAHLAESAAEGNLLVGAARGGNNMRTTWVYALATAFPTLTDGVSLSEIERAWRGEEGKVFNSPLMLSPSTRAAFEGLWGPARGSRLKEMPEGKLLDTAWENRDSWALIPFEQIQPRWKVLRVDGVSPLDPGLNVERYPLAVWFGVSGSPEALRLLDERMAMAQQASGEEASAASLLPSSNYNSEKMTTLVMTGVTALTRATGHKMDTLGMTYPGEDIADWLRFADFTHISNEVSFNTECPPANPVAEDTTFCSRPEYIELLEYIGADIIEVTGNHNNDWGRAANRYTLEEYRKRGWPYFGGGLDLKEAHEPVKIKHNGNKLAFIGCNLPGPPGAFATDSQPGAAPCDNMEWMLDTIRSLREDGYLPIVTFQYLESYVFQPSSRQVEDFRAAAEAGAVIVSGSQAHFPQTMEFDGGSFIHYGLGNLFFDQMDYPVEGTRREFVDRHTFYGGRYIQTELLTAMLEDYARPRPMNESERQAFLSDIFQAGGW